MDMKKIFLIAFPVLWMSVGIVHDGMAQNNSDSNAMSFFITSTGPGNGADLGGLDGADQHCQSLAEAEGAGNRTWRAYLSTSTSGSEAAVNEQDTGQLVPLGVRVNSSETAINARDRIGQGPWYNAKGVMVARDVEHLHGEDNNLNKETALNEKGEMVNGRGDDPNMHDILTGSQLDGTAFTGNADKTCSDWTSNDEGSAQVGHHDRDGGGENPTSWNSAHGSRGCSQSDLQGTGGNGLFYCFATE